MRTPVGLHYIGKLLDWLLSRVINKIVSHNTRNGRNHQSLLSAGIDVKALIDR